jgi:hypothetical protein
VNHGDQGRLIHAKRLGVNPRARIEDRFTCNLQRLAPGDLYLVKTYAGRIEDMPAVGDPEHPWMFSSSYRR